MLTDELTPTNVGLLNRHSNVGDFVGQFFVFKFDQQLSLRNSFAIGDLNVPDKARSLSSDNGQVPVINNTRFPVQQDIFITRLRVLLNARTQGKMRFLARERMETLREERDMKRSGDYTSSSDPILQEFKGADFFLTGKLDGQTTRTSAGTSDYVLYSFQLIDARSSEILWEDFSEIKKQGLEDASYR